MGPLDKTRWVKSLLGCTVHSISTKTNQEGIKCTNAFLSNLYTVERRLLGAAVYTYVR